jgi:serine/threonine-protein kinase
MAPEQLRAERTDARSDVYGLGCLLYTTLTGRPPFSRPTAAATITAHLESPIPRISNYAGVPHAFDDVIFRALEKDPQRRYPSAGDLGRAAVRAAQGQETHELGHSVARGEAAPLAETRVVPQEALPPTAKVALKENKRRNVWIEALVIVAFFVVAGIVTAVALLNNGSDPNRPLSNADVARTARSFARAYTREDARALARLLAPDVQRVSASDVQRGRSAVVGAYRSQFRSQVTRAYRLDNLKVDAGSAGRAEAHFTVVRGGRPSISGQVVLGVERRNGRARIRLIATESRT